MKIFTNKGYQKAVDKQLAEREKAEFYNRRHENLLCRVDELNAAMHKLEFRIEMLEHKSKRKRKE